MFKLSDGRRKPEHTPRVLACLTCFTRRSAGNFRQAACGKLLAVLAVLVCWGGSLAAEDSDKRVPRIAAIVTEYRHNAHADVIVSRLLEGFTLDGQGEFPRLKLVSLYTDQVPQNDTSRKFAEKYGFQIFPTVGEALTLGGEQLAVDGVLLVAEHGDYPESEVGQIEFPKRRLFSQIVEVFEKSGRVVPVFNDKHLSDNWKDAKWMYDAAQRLNIPLMAGSSLPVLWRYPPTDVPRGAQLKQMVAVSYHRLDSYGFHAVEMVQTLAERRDGGETGVEAVQCLTGQAVWDAGRRGVYDSKLLEACLSRLQSRRRADKPLEEVVKEPILCVIDYRDGFRANILTLNGAVAEWSAAWNYADREGVDSTLFWTQEARPFMHFTYLLKGAEQMFHTGKPTWPVERTLLTSGVLDGLHISRKEKGRRLSTPFLDVKYQSNWNWQQPPPPPEGRPISAQ